MYDLKVASLYKKMISGKPYWYLREMARVDGKPKMVSERYLGSAADIEALLDAREAGDDAGADPAPGVRGRGRGVGDADRPGRGRHHRRGGRARARRGRRRSGTYLALAALNRLVDPCSKRAFADWWKSTAADRFTRISAAALDHRKFWDAMHAVGRRGAAATSRARLAAAA